MIHCVCHGNKFGKLNLVFGVQIPAAWHQQNRQMMSFPLFHWYHLFVKVVVHIRTSHLRPITALPSSERVEFIQNISLIRCLLHFALLCDLQQSVQFIIINKGQWLKLTSDWFLQNMNFDCSFLPLFRLFSKSDTVADMMRRLLAGLFYL